MKVKLIYLVVSVLAVLLLLNFIRSSNEGYTDLNNAGELTLYFASWCPHCKTITPQFREFGKNGFVTIAGKNVKVSVVEPEKEPAKAAGKTIKGYPTILYSGPDGKTVEYQGERNEQGYVKFLEEQLNAGSNDVS